MDKKLLTGIAIGVVAGILFAPQIRRIPLVSKIPSL